VKTSIVWFRNDLRIAGNPALFHSARTGRLLPIYIWDETFPEQEGGASRWWFHESLLALGRSLSTLGSPLVFARGNTLEVLLHHAKQSKSQKIVWNERTTPRARAFDRIVREKLISSGLEVETYPPDLLKNPLDIVSKNGPYRVFSHFWKQLRPSLDPEVALPAPEKISPPETIPLSESLSDWGWNPQKPDWAKEMRKQWVPGEKQAHETLNAFLRENLLHYANRRDRLDGESFSRLSPFLHAGEITSSQIVQKTLDKLTNNPTWSPDGEKFLSEIGWREFSKHLLLHFPQMPEEPFQKKFARFPWKKDTANLLAWQSGKTGYPVVDAAMRQLWKTGFIPNRARMIVASFLSKDLLISWKEGARWFAETLVDHDLANNTVSWQWVSGMGVDAAPYFRILNPVLQGEKFDPRGDYVRKWVPEISGLPDHLIHHPWEASEELLKKAGVALGIDYPWPVIKHHESRKEALSLFQRLGENSSREQPLPD